jgi:hypothetical protein
MKPLKEGMRGEEVRILQEALNNFFTPRNWHPLDTKGSFGPATKKYVIEFQKRVNEVSQTKLRVNGEVGADTWRELLACYVGDFVINVGQLCGAAVAVGPANGESAVEATARTGTASADARAGARAAPPLTTTSTSSASKPGAAREPELHWAYRGISLGETIYIKPWQVHGRRGQQPPPTYNSLTLNVGLTMLRTTDGLHLEHSFAVQGNKNDPPYDSRYTLQVNYTLMASNLISEGQLHLLNQFLHPFAQVGPQVNLDLKTANTTYPYFVPSSPQLGLCAGDQIQIDVIENVLSLVVQGCAALQVDLRTGQVTLGPQVYINLNVNGSFQSR